MAKIIPYYSSDLVYSADEKFLYLAFCIEMSKLDFFINSGKNVFKTYLTIQLNAICNRYQHLAFLSNETKIFKNFNLTSSNKNNDAEDFYQYIVDILNVY